jgi:hypothetical protein
MEEVFAHRAGAAAGGRVLCDIIELFLYASEGHGMGVRVVETTTQTQFFAAKKPIWVFCFVLYFVIVLRFVLLSFYIFVLLSFCIFVLYFL